MKRLIVYPVAILALALVAALGQYFLGDKLFTAYRLRFPPAHRVIDNPEYLNSGLDTVVWEHIKAGKDGKPSVSIGFLHMSTGTKKEQAAMIEFLNAAGNLKDDGPYVVVWFWVGYPENDWVGVVCPPGLENPCQKLPGSYTLQAESWQELVVAPGWVR